ncbi:MAG: class I SAM-dependent methyltransferase [Rhodomicrobium sp.]|nr:class I SAM-dependent methyltransferase [Rhodomicrobium sp.]
MDNAYSPHGAALADYFGGNTSATLICIQDGERDDVPASFWFREVSDPIELMALDLCRGRVLDLGAGTGLHALELQRRGIDVTAIDIAPECVEIMRRRGVEHAVCADLYGYDGGPFDTIACLCNGLDKVGRLSDLPAFLARMKSLLAPGGHLLADSFDLRVNASPEHVARMARKEAEGRYFGEMGLVSNIGAAPASPSPYSRSTPIR